MTGCSLGETGVGGPQLTIVPGGSLDRRVALVTAIATLCTCGAAGAALGVVYEPSPGDAHDVPPLTQPVAADAPASTVAELAGPALVPTAPLVVVPDGASPTPTLAAATAPAAGRPSARATTPSRPPAAISGAPVAGTIPPGVPASPTSATPVTSASPTTAPAATPTTVTRDSTTSVPTTVTSTPATAPAPSAPATSAPATSAPATTAAPTTTVRPPGVPKDWPANKPIPPMPADCEQPQLEDNGVWNCQ